MTILKNIYLIIFVIFSFFICGCATTTITEYDKNGNIIKVTESDQSAFAIAMTSILEKDNFIHGSFWAIGINPATSTYGIGAGDFVAGSLNKENATINALSYATMINASKVSLDITADKYGITANATYDKALSKNNDQSNTNTTNKVSNNSIKATMSKKDESK